MAQDLAPTASAKLSAEFGKRRGVSARRSPVFDKIKEWTRIWAIGFVLWTVLAFLGALSILLGYRAKIGAWMIALFLLAITPVMHNFWGVQDAATQQIQMAMFMKNVSMLGAALLISQLGSGSWSLDARRKESRGV